MKRLVPAVVCVLLATSPGSGQDREASEVTGFVHEIVEPLAQSVGPLYGLYPDGGGDLVDGARVIHLSPAGEQVRLAPLRGRRATLRGEMQLLLGPQRLLIVEEVVGAAGEPTADELRADLAARAPRWFEEATTEAEGGFDGEHLLCPDGAPSAVIPLEVPPPDTADLFTVTAYVCADTGRWWVRRTGGFAGVVQWLGPWDVPGAGLGPPRIERAPTEVRRARLRIRRRARTRRLTFRREVEPTDAAGLGRDRYGPSDFDLGDGMAVQRVLRVTSDRVRVAVRVAPDAPAGERHPRLLGRAGRAVLTLVPR